MAGFSRRTASSATRRGAGRSSSTPKSLSTACPCIRRFLILRESVIRWTDAPRRLKAPLPSVKISPFQKPSAVHFVVLGDGNVLWRSDPVQAHGAVRDFSIDVSEVHILESRQSSPTRAGTLVAMPSGSIRSCELKMPRHRADDPDSLPRSSRRFGAKRKWSRASRLLRTAQRCSLVRVSTRICGFLTSWTASSPIRSTSNSGPFRHGALRRRRGDC